MILAIDTSAGTSVAVIADGSIRAEVGTADTMRHAEVIGDYIQAALQQAGITAAEITHVVAGVGPGPFTGLRVGLAAAVTFAEARAIPLLPVVSHDAAALLALAEAGALGSDAAESASADLLIVTDARRKELYFSTYSGVAGGIPQRSRGPELSRPDALPSRENGQLSASAVTVEVPEISAGALGLVADAMLAGGHPFMPFEALYLRSPDVTLSAGPKRVVQEMKR